MRGDKIKMPHLTLISINSTKAHVIGAHNFPEQLTEEQKAGGVLVDSVLPPPAVTGQGKALNHYINQTTLERWYEEVSRPLTQDEKLDGLTSENHQLRAELEQVKAENVDTTTLLLEMYEQLNPPA